MNQSTVSQSFPSPLSPLPSAPATSFMTNETQAEESVLVYLIDFTRWEMIENTNDMKKDENFLYGLYYLIDLFKRAANDNSSSLPADAIPTKNTVQS
ncbi:unnamed protein product [Trichobilharzia regenti]|nr:unnamed protein product [Trichobilharzia regenti]